MVKFMERKKGYRKIVAWILTFVMVFTTVNTPAFTLAVKAEETVTVTFDTNGGDAIDSQSILKGSNATKPTDPTKTGYTFEHWYIRNGTVDEAFDFNTTINENITLVAKWEKQTYKITYDLNGGSLESGDINPESYNIESEKITLKNPTKQGYVFVGWTGSNGTTAQTAVSIEKGSTGDKEFKATWTIINYSINYELDGGELATDKENPTQYNVVSDDIRLNNPSKDGCIFTGWTGSNGTATETEVTIKKGTTGDLSYTAHWEKSITVTFDTNGGNDIPSQTIAKNTKATKPTDPEKNGYTFKGWYISTETTDEFDFETAIAEDKTLYAKWDKKTYTITYDLDGGSLAENVENPTSYDVEKDTIKLNNPEKNGYTFAGWTGSNGTTAQTEVSIAKGSTGNKDYKATWTKDTYTISYDLNGGALAEGKSNPTSYEVDTETIKLNNPEKKGYTFAGWTGANGTTAQTEVSIAKGSTGDKDYKATWTKDTYTIHYDLDGGALAEGKSNPTSYEVDTETITLNNPEKKGYTFAGWTGANGTTAQTEVSIAKGSTGDKDYKATWTKDTYTINYDLNGGALAEGKSNPTSYEVDTEKITLNSPEKNGYTFAGWTGSNGTTAQNNVSIEKGSTGKLTYTANWVKNDISVQIAAETYTYNGSAQQPGITVTDVQTQNLLKEGTDYTVTYVNNINAGIATIQVAGIKDYADRTGNVTFEIQKAQITPGYTVTAYCGDKLSDIVVNPDGVNGVFRWNYTEGITENTEVKENPENPDAEFVAYATFEPENQNYETLDKVEIKVKPVHNFENSTTLVHEQAVNVSKAKEKAGHREFYYCEACGQYFNSEKQAKPKEYYTIPYVKGSITVTLGSTVKMNGYVKDGKDGIDSIELSGASTYKKYLTFDEKTGTIKTPKKYYTKKIKNPTLTVTDKAGDKYKVKVNLQIKKPTVKISKKPYTSVSGIKAYRYTIKCSAAEADGIIVSVSAGLAQASTKTKLNKYLKTNSKNQIKITKKKASGTITFTIAKTSIKKDKLTFQVYGTYGQNKSAVCEKSK